MGLGHIDHDLPLPIIRMKEAYRVYKRCCPGVESHGGSVSLASVWDQAKKRTIVTPTSTGNCKEAIWADWTAQPQVGNEPEVPKYKPTLDLVRYENRPESRAGFEFLPL